MKKFMMCLLWTILTVILLISLPVQADDTPLSAMGDNVGPFEGTPPVIMDKEIINLEVYPSITKVNVTFWLRNTGKDQTILVGFPDEYATCNSENASEDCVGTNILGPINDFKVKVNNKPVKSTVKTQIKKITSKEEFSATNSEEKVEERISENIWHTWPVKFEKNKTTVINNTYWVLNGRTSCTATRNFAYTLLTGANWKGNIGEAILNVNFNDGLSYKDLYYDHWPPTTAMKPLSNTRTQAVFKNFKPKEEINRFDPKLVGKSKHPAHIYLSFNTNKSLYSLINKAEKSYFTENDVANLDSYCLTALINGLVDRSWRKGIEKQLNNENSSPIDKLAESEVKVIPAMKARLNKFARKNLDLFLKRLKTLDKRLIYGN